jgi:hypothetical protein
MIVAVAPRRPPLAVALFVAVVVAALLVILVVHGVDGWLIGGGGLLLLASYGLLRGVWIAWVFLTVVAAGDLAVTAMAGPAWLPLALNLALLALLLAPSTRRHVAWPSFLAKSSR